MNLPDSVEVIEVCPRDGFQRLDSFVPTDEKIEFVNALSETGVAEIEVTSFTHPEAVPNLRDAEAVFEGIDRHPDVAYTALVPNDVGMERALDCGLEQVNAIIQVCETYNRKNQNMTHEENLDQIDRIVEMAGDSVTVEAGVGNAFYSPYEGRIEPAETRGIVDAVLDRGVDEVSLATTVGLANPREVYDLFSAITDDHPDVEFAFHLHNTNGMSLANVLAAMLAGVSRFDASVAGLGGGTIFPDDLRNIGNTPTEDLVHMLSGMGIETGVDFGAIRAVAADIQDRLGVGDSYVLRRGTLEDILEATGG